MKYRLILVLLIAGTVLLFIPVYFKSMEFLGYEVGHDPANVERLLKRAIETKNPAICKKIIVPPQLFGGPARYDLVNGCFAGYATTMGDTSLCQQVISPGLCVTRIAKDRNDPELCAEAWAPERASTDDYRGSCFGYFAGREKNYGWCERLLLLPDMNEAQQQICFNTYMDKTGDLELCHKVNKLFPDYEPADWVDACYFSTAYATGRAEFCNNIKDSENRSRCLDRFASDE